MLNPHPATDGEHLPVANDFRRTLPPSLAARLDQTRQAFGISYRQLALEAHISLGHAFGIVTGSRCPSRAVAVRVARALRLDPQTADDLYQEAVEEYPVYRPNPAASPRADPASR